MTFWIYEIPVWVIAVALLAVGSIKIGEALRIVGTILLVLAGILFLLSFRKTGRGRAERRLFSLWFGFQGAVALAIGLYFGDRSFLEVIFRGWFF